MNVRIVGRAFIYMPLMHSEELKDHDLFLKRMTDNLSTESDKVHYAVSRIFRL